MSFSGTNDAVVEENFTIQQINEDDENLCPKCLLEVHYDSFNRNLLRNGFGAISHDRNCELRCSLVNPPNMHVVRVCVPGDCPKFNYWTILESGGMGWSVEEPPQGCAPLPEVLRHKSCFVTSYGFCSKQQIINLRTVGLTDRIMDEVRPDIEVSEWHAAHKTAGCIYFIKISLLDDEMQIMHVYGQRRKVLQGEGGTWHKVTYTFKDYDPGVRNVLFSHAGQDTQSWGGYYGSKMCGGSVIAKIPRPWHRQSSTESKHSSGY